jgi:hypothetical protein
MRTVTFIGTALLVVAVVLAVAGIAGMPKGVTCSGSFHFVEQNCPGLLRGFALLFAGFSLGSVGGIVLYRSRR